MLQSCTTRSLADEKDLTWSGMCVSYLQDGVCHKPPKQCRVTPSDPTSKKSFHPVVTIYDMMDGGTKIMIRPKFAGFEDQLFAIGFKAYNRSFQWDGKSRGYQTNSRTYSHDSMSLNEAHARLLEQGRLLNEQSSKNAGIKPNHIKLEQLERTRVLLPGVDPTLCGAYLRDGVCDNPDNCRVDQKNQKSKKCLHPTLGLFELPEGGTAVVMRPVIKSWHKQVESAGFTSGVPFIWCGHERGWQDDARVYTHSTMAYAEAYDAIILSASTATATTTTTPCLALRDVHLLVNKLPSDLVFEDEKEEEEEEEIELVVDSSTESNTPMIVSNEGRILCMSYVFEGTCPNTPAKCRVNPRDRRSRRCIHPTLSVFQIPENRTAIVMRPVVDGWREVLSTVGFVEGSSFEWQAQPQGDLEGCTVFVRDYACATDVRAYLVKCGIPYNVMKLHLLPETGVTGDVAVPSYVTELLRTSSSSSSSSSAAPSHKTDYEFGKKRKRSVVLGSPATAPDVFKTPVKRERKAKAPFRTPSPPASDYESCSSSAVAPAIPKKRKFNRVWIPSKTAMPLFGRSRQKNNVQPFRRKY